MSVHFAPLHPTDHKNGFDPQGGGPAIPGLDPPGALHVPSQIVPIGRTAVSVLVLEADGVTVVSQHPAITMTQSPPQNGISQIDVTSTTTATAYLVASRGATTVGRLLVCPLPMVILPVSFHVLYDNVRHSHRPLADCAHILRVMNNVYIPQTNIMFVPGILEPEFRVAADLGAIVDASHHHYFINQRPQSDLHVFFVWEYAKTQTIVVNGQQVTTDVEAATWDYSFCCLEDHVVGPPGKIVAHEAGHWLNLHGAGIDSTGHTSVQQELMYASTPSGYRIRREHASQLNFSAQARPGVRGGAENLWSY